MPALLAARIFSLMPPTGRTLPVKESSPVMASFDRAILPVSKEYKAVAMVIPAEGPSLGMAPAGMCKWMSCF